MAANDNVLGRVSAWAGKTWGTRRPIAGFNLDSTIADNAMGSNGPTLAPSGGVVQDNIPLNSVITPLVSGPHLLEGENLYFAIDPNTDGKAVDSTGAAGTVLKFKYHRRDLKTGHIESLSEVAETNRNTTTTTGGLKDDMTVYQGRPNPIYAFLLTPAGTDATLYGAFQIDVRTTA